MLETNTETETPPAAAASHRATFLRESGWLMMANVAGGILNWAVHPLAKRTGPLEYGIFVAFLGVALCVPTMPLQLVFTQQTANAIATQRRGELSSLIRMTVAVTFLIWLMGALIVVALRRTILEHWHLTNPIGLWIIVPVVLLNIWLPMFSGILQGAQNFLWLGWSMIINGVGRVALAAVAVLLLSGKATGMLTGVLFGMLVAGAVVIWQSRELWLEPRKPFDWRPLLQQVIPLLLGAAAFQFLFTADMMFAQSYLKGEMPGYYGSAGTLSRALLWLVGPLAAVMFPRIVHSAAKGHKTNLVNMVLLGTAVLAIGGAVGLSLLGPFVVRFVYTKDFVGVASQLLPWYASAMVPLSLANVLLSNLFARSHFKIVPALCVLSAVYGFALTKFHATPVMMLQTLCVANFMLLGIAALFTWVVKPAEKESTEDALPGTASS